MIQGVNDSDACAHELADRLKGMLCHVNLIPANEVAGKSHRRSSQARLRAFCGVLEKRGVNVTVRRTLGADILSLIHICFPPQPQQSPRAGIPDFQSLVRVGQPVQQTDLLSLHAPQNAVDEAGGTGRCV